MKSILIALLSFIAITALLFAQGRTGSNPGSEGYLGSYDGGTPPPVSLPEAYGIALTHIGSASNAFYCLSASCVDDKGHRGWTFKFGNTNGQRGRVIVYFTRGVSPMLPGGGRMYLDK
jgi:hypothetical protein